MENYYYAQTTMLGHSIYMLASDKGLMYLSSDEQNELEFFTAIKKLFHIDANQMVYHEQNLMPYIKQLKRFEQGKPPEQHKLSYDLRGTAFQKQVWQALLTIPFAETTYYGAIAQHIGNTKAVRAVGGAIGANPILILIPCHRVIGKDGSLTGFSSGLPLKQQLLDHEQKYFVN